MRVHSYSLFYMLIFSSHRSQARDPSSPATECRLFQSVSAASRKGSGHTLHSSFTIITLDLVKSRLVVPNISFDGIDMR